MIINRWRGTGQCPESVWSFARLSRDSLGPARAAPPSFQPKLHKSAQSTAMPSRTSAETVDALVGQGFLVPTAGCGTYIPGVTGELLGSRRT